MESTPNTRAAEPREFTPVEIDGFVSLVLAGGEVIPHGLRARVIQAAQLAFTRENGCVVAVAGLKKPSQNHRNEVAAGSKTQLPERDYPLELGWVFIRPSARGRKLSFPLCQVLVTAANGRGIFATSRVDNHALHSTLMKVGFSRIGAEWPSRQNDGNLALFVKRGG